MSVQAPAWFWDKVRVCGYGPGGCWEWTGRRRNDYGVFSVGRRGSVRSFATHRHVYELIHGPIPEGLFVMHRCDHPPCCNPDHLFLGTPKENAHDMLRKGRHGGMPNIRGEAHYAASLRDEDVRFIRSQRRMYGAAAALACIHNVSIQVISDICLGKKWRHIEGDEREAISLPELRTLARQREKERGDSPRVIRVFKSMIDRPPTAPLDEARRKR